MNRLAFHRLLPIFLFALSGSASALGLGELRGQPNLGDNLKLEVDILGEGKLSLDSNCFRLEKPASGDIPWLKKATFSIRKGSPAVLQIRSDIPLREPILQIAVRVGCGHEVAREYLVLASPARESSTLAKPRMELVEPEVDSTAVVERRRAPKLRPPQAAEPAPAPVRLSPRKPEKRLAASNLPDRLLLSNGTEVGEPSLRLATDILSLSAGRDIKEAQREILRLEFRMLLAMNEQATTQLETAEKLRTMEATLGELQQRATQFAQNVEKGAAPTAPLPPRTETAPAPTVPEKPAPAELPVKHFEESAGFSEWSLYGAALGALLGLGGWLAWRRYQQRAQEDSESDFPLQPPELRVDPKRDDEREELGGIDLAVEPSAMGMPMKVDFELGAGEPAGTPAVARPISTPSSSLDSVLSISATTLDEHFEANPVMELADIMLSFGRVKGAAQALQEYIDNNPQEALQPWIRLMDVYRMAGMRAEFEAVSRNLNQNFNVEVQQWESAPSAGKPHPVDLVLDETVEHVTPHAPKPECLEDMPRLMAAVVELWGTGDVVGYLYQLLRDNRGGQRTGFSLPVVEEILFLIELKETSNRMEKEPAAL